LLLAVGQHHETDRLVRHVVGTAVQPDEAAAEHGELDRQFVALPDARDRRDMPRINVAVGKGRGVKLRRFARLALVEPQACDEIGHVRSPCLRGGRLATTATDRPTKIIAGNPFVATPPLRAPLSSWRRPGRRRWIKLLSRAIRTIPRAAARTRRACAIRTP
ncbi:hypothetical protein chiPu_0033377, partial [Chiloscyllium punctatum]|nr:hypothetical protein [Chiloscyllium punctatum]